jgi:N-carbamoylputrescine amidase
MIVNVGLIQMGCSPDPAANLARATDGIRDAARRGAQVVCLPELFLGRYFCQTEDHAHFALAEEIPGPTTGLMSGLAADLGVVLVVPLFEKRAPGVYHNSAAVIDADGKYLGKYRKMHIPDDPLYLEKFYFTPGDLGFRAWNTRFGRIGVLICWDQWYPEAARLAAMDGAQVLFYPTAIGWHPSEKADLGEDQRSSWETIQRAHSIANGVFVAAVNRVGHEGPSDGGLEFWGSSFVAAPGGRILAKAGVSGEEILVAPCALPEVETYRTQWPFLRDRRIDAYGDITRRLLD